MSEWKKQRKCVHCGATFSLEEHAHFGAQGLAATLDVDPDNISAVSPDSIVNKCPKCAGQLSEIDPMGMIEAMKISEEQKQKKRKRRDKMVMGIGCLIMVLIGLGSIGALIMTFMAKQAQ